MALDEYDLIERLRRSAAKGLDGSVRLGIGDDAAIVAPPRRAEETLLTTDQVVENTHFVANVHPAEALGHKCLARALSDIAAMGGTPRHFLLSLCLPGWATQPEWLRSFTRGLLRLGRSTSVMLVGGDVARGERFAAHVTVAASVPEGKALRRTGARAGDLVYVSGRLGGSWLGFKRLNDDRASTTDPAVRRHLFPLPRLALGRFLREKLAATSAIDLSDGLSTDLGRLTKASGVGAEIQQTSIPCFPGSTIQQALHGGEEYELLFTAPPEIHVPGSFKGVRLTAIGAIRAARGVLLCSDQRHEPLEARGFEHFSG